MSRTLRLGSRGSALALAQSQAVADLLRPVWGHGPVEVVTVVTAGDRLQREPAAAAPGFGLFVKEIEGALLAGRVDLCVHSAKDVPPEQPQGLGLVAFPRRADARDALCGGTLAGLPPGARVGTGSLRRGLQLQAHRPDLRLLPLRGNVDTRLARLHAGAFDALVLAAAGLLRLGRGSEITEALSPEVVVPAAGQGALALEARLDDAAVVAALARLEDAPTAFAVLAERAVLAGLGGGCTAPTGAWAHPAPDGGLRLTAVVCGVTSGRLARATVECPAPPAGARALLAAAAAACGAAAVRALAAEGAGALLLESPSFGEAHT